MASNPNEDAGLPAAVLLFLTHFISEGLNGRLSQIDN